METTMERFSMKSWAFLTVFLPVVIFITGTLSRAADMALEQGIQPQATDPLTLFLESYIDALRAQDWIMAGGLLLIAFMAFIWAMRSKIDIKELLKNRKRKK